MRGAGLHYETRSVAAASINAEGGWVARPMAEAEFPPVCVGVRTNLAHRGAPLTSQQDVHRQRQSERRHRNRKYHADGRPTGHAFLLSALESRRALRLQVHSGEMRFVPGRSFRAGPLTL